MFEQGQQAIFVELTDEDSTKRYLVPNDVSAIARLKYLLTQYSSVMLVRSGMAMIKSQMDKDVTSVVELKNIPATVDGLYNVFMPDHPEVKENFARYSSELIELINQVQLGSEEVNNVDTATLGSSEMNLTEQLRAQVGAPATVARPAARPAAPSAPSSPNPTADLTAQLKGQLVEKRLSRRSVDLPLGPSRSEIEIQSGSKYADDFVDGLPKEIKEVLDKADFDYEEYISKFVEEIFDQVLEIKDDVKQIRLAMLQLTMGAGISAVAGSKKVTGEQLSKWFAEAAAVNGFNDAFDVLAAKLNGEVVEVEEGVS